MQGQGSLAAGSVIDWRSPTRPQRAVRRGSADLNLADAIVRLVVRVASLAGHRLC